MFVYVCLCVFVYVIHQGLEDHALDSCSPTISHFVSKSIATVEGFGPRDCGPML